MIAKTQVDEITEALMSLPPAKVAAVRDFVEFLKSRYAPDGAVDASDEWSDEDLRDFAASSAAYRETIAPSDEDGVSPSEEPEESNGK